MVSANAFPIKRLLYTYTDLFDNTINSVWTQFWSSDKQSWSTNDKCVGNFQYPSVWDQAVAGKAITEYRDASKINMAIASLKQYLNGNNWFSSSTAKDNDVYIDDNAQILWVLLDSYKYAGNIEDLNLAKKLMDNIKGQEYNGGGVKWSLNGDYAASISTGEAALAAVRLYQETQDQSLLDFAANQINWILDTLQDPSDGLIYDGITISTGDLDKGKLTYSVGTMISTLAYLATYTGDSSYYDKALALTKSALNHNGAFYNLDGTWNNALKYSHLLFIGITDLITVYTATDQTQSAYYQQFIKELNFQAQNILNTKQVSSNNYVDNVKAFVSDATNFCYGSPKQSLLDNMSAAQIYYAMSRIV